MDEHTLHVGVRVVHVLAATVLVGGSLGLALAGWGARDPAASPGFLRMAARYETWFWLAVAAIIATGVGNLAVFGDALPGPEPDWGRTFSLKLALVLTLLLMSVVRVVAVVRLRDLGVERAGERRAGRARRLPRTGSRRGGVTRR